MHIAVDATPADEPATAALRQRAAALASELGLPLQWTLSDAEQATADGLLAVTPPRLELRWRRPLGADTRQRLRPIAVDFAAIDVTSGPGRSRNQPLARAVGIPHHGHGSCGAVLDLTAGLCEDAWLLASWGCRVTAVERSPVTFALARDGLARAGGDERLREIAARLTLVHADAVDFLGRAALRDGPTADAVYLDPMFPARAKRALESKTMRVLRQVVGDDADAAVVARTVLAAVPCSRLVVKRPLHGGRLLAEVEPVAVHRGKALRWDVYGGRRK